MAQLGMEKQWPFLFAMLMLTFVYNNDSCECSYWKLKSMCGEEVASKGVYCSDGNSQAVLL